MSGAAKRKSATESKLDFVSEDAEVPAENCDEVDIDDDLIEKFQSSHYEETLKRRESSFAISPRFMRSVSTTETIPSINAPARFSGESSYRQTIVFLLMIAGQRVFPDKEFVCQSIFGFSLTKRSYLCRFVDFKMSKEMVRQLKSEMDKLVKAHLNLGGVWMKYKACLEVLKKSNQSLSYKLVETLNRDQVQMLRMVVPKQLDKYVARKEASPEPAAREGSNSSLNSGQMGSGSDLSYMEKSIDYLKNDVYFALRHRKALPNTKFVRQFELFGNEDGTFTVAFPDKNNPNAKIQRPKTSKAIQALFTQGVKLGNILNLRCVGDINESIQRGREKELILISEAFHDMQIVNIARHVSTNRGKIRVILISGPSSSGKTTFASKLAIQLRLQGLKPIGLEVDMYYRAHADPDYPRDKNGTLNFETVDAIRCDKLNEDIKALLDGKPVRAPEFNFIDGTFNDDNPDKQPLILERDGVLVMEGIFCLNPKLTKIIPNAQKYKVFIGPMPWFNLDNLNFLSEQFVRVVRRVSRDNRHRGRSAEGTLFKWGQLKGGEEENIFPFIENADAVFNSSLVYEIPVLNVYSAPLMQTVRPNSERYKDATTLLSYCAAFAPMPDSNIPATSLLMEFIGNSVFDELSG